MISTDNKDRSYLLPNRHNLKFIYGASLIIAVLLTIVSLAGLLLPDRIYPTKALLQSFKVNDLVNLIIGVPILLGSIHIARREKLIGLLFWPGALMYVVYNYIAYLIAMPFNFMYIVYAILVVGSVSVFFYLVSHVDIERIKQRLQSNIREKLSGGVLIGFGVAFFLRAISHLVDPVLSGTSLPTTDLSVLISDIVLSLGWIISGELIWRRKALGYLLGGAFLFQGATLFLGLILFLIFNPLLTQAPFDIVALITIIVMSVICNIPFGLYTLGVSKSHDQLNAGEIYEY